MPRRVFVALLPLLLLAPRASACSIPVFRYAFERWVPGKWDVFVYHRGPLNDGQRELLKRLNDTKLANINVVDVDLNAKPDPKHTAFFNRITGPHELPLLALRAPDAEPKAPPAWLGSLHDKNVAAMLDSPVRQSITRFLAKGPTAMLVLLESGDRARDDEAEKLVRKFLPKMEATLLPDPSKEGTQPRSSLPLKVAFDVLRVSRTSQREGPFIRMLLSVDPGLEKVKGPILFPIFGRGRALGGLHGDDLSTDELGHVARFLCGKCTCELKELNPGTDLLFAADWESFVDGTAEAESAVHLYSGHVTETKVTEVVGPGPQVIENILDGLLKNYWPVLLVAVALILIAGSWWMFRRR